MLVALSATLACQGSEPPSSGDAGGAGGVPQRPAATPPAPAAPSAPLSLRVPSDQLTRVEILRKGAPKGQRRIVLEKSRVGAGAEAQGEWTVVSPVRYRANQAAMETIVAVLAEIEILTSEEGDERAARRQRLDNGSGVEIKAWVGDRLASHFMVGSSAREATYVRRLGEGNDGQILTVRGRCRPVFDRSLDQLRHPVITDVDVKKIQRVLYSNPEGQLELVPDQRTPGKFVDKDGSIRNFNAVRASQSVSVAAHLLAKGFADDSVDLKATGLFDDDTSKATLFRAGKPPLHVWVGARTPNGQLYVRTSQSKQIYLVSSHLESSLAPRRSHFERSDEHMSELEDLRKKRALEEAAHDEAAHDEAAGAGHTHGLPPANASQVPPELMEELRGLAQKQRDRAGP